MKRDRGGRKAGTCRHLLHSPQRLYSTYSASLHARLPSSWKLNRDTEEADFAQPQFQAPAQAAQPTFLQPNSLHLYSGHGWQEVDRQRGSPPNRQATTKKIPTEHPRSRTMMTTTSTSH